MPLPRQEDEWSSVLRAGLATWPDLSISAEALMRWASARGLAPSSDRAADWALACACEEADPRALGYVRRELAPELRRAIARAHPDPALADDVLQELTVRLALSGRLDGSARGARYDGRGSFGGFLRVCAVRMALDARRREAREVRLDELVVDGIACADGPSQALLERHRPVLRAALTSTLEALEPRDRTLLRLSTIDALSIDRIAAIYGVHRATAARWLAQVRARVLEGTRASFAERLGADRAEDLDSLLRALSSQLDASLERVLGA